MRHWLLASLCTVASGAALAGSACPQLYARNTPPQIVKAAVARATRELCFETFVVMHSGVTRTPLWSAEHQSIQQLGLAEDLSREDSFHAEDRLPEAERAELEDYKSSGYDRGHMSPNHDMPDRDAQHQSFSLANMIPQAPKVNRGLWADIEETVRHEIESGRTLYVVTGPLFEGQRLQQLNGRVLVPTAAFKAVYDSATGRAGAYVVTNDKNAEHQDIKASVISMAELTRRSGIDVFPFLSVQAKAQAMDLPVPHPQSHSRHDK